MSSIRSGLDRKRIKCSVAIAVRASRYETKDRRDDVTGSLTTANREERSRVRDRRGLWIPTALCAQRSQRRSGVHGALLGVILSLLSPVATVCSADPQSSLAIFQHLIETVPGEYELRAFSLSVASGSESTATVTTLTDSDGKVRRGFTVAAAGEDVSSEPPFTLLAPEGWSTTARVGSTSPQPPRHEDQDLSESKESAHPPENPTSR